MADELKKPDHRWPDEVLQAGDHFVDSQGPDWQLNACTGPQVRPDFAWSYYSDGFRDAARALAKQVIEYSNPMELPVDTAVYPIIYLYRHHFELVIKAIIHASSDLIGQSDPKPWGHSLKRLWATAQPLVEQAFPEADWSQNTIVSSLIDEIDGLDPDGQQVRYPEDRDGNRALAGVPRIHIRHFADVSERLCHYFEQVLFALEHTIEQKKEWEAEARHWGE